MIAWSFVIPVVVISLAFMYVPDFIIFNTISKQELTQLRATKKEWTDEEWENAVKALRPEIDEKVKQSRIVKLCRWIGYIIAIWGTIYAAINYE